MVAGKAVWSNQLQNMAPKYSKFSRGGHATEPRASSSSSWHPKPKEGVTFQDERLVTEDPTTDVRKSIHGEGQEPTLKLPRDTAWPRGRHSRVPRTTGRYSLLARCCCAPDRTQRCSGVYLSTVEYSQDTLRHALQYRSNASWSWAVDVYHLLLHPSDAWCRATTNASRHRPGSAQIHQQCTMRNEREKTGKATERVPSAKGKVEKCR